MENNVNYKLLMQTLSQIALTEFYETDDKAKAYHISEPQAVTAVITQKGNARFGSIWKQHDVRYH